MKKCLSIQSHVVYGYVGNKCAVPVMQSNGFDVSPINSVQLSNHSGYSNGFKGEVLEGAQLESLVEGLAMNNLLFHTHLLTGYMRSASFLRSIVKILEKLKVS